MRFRVFIITIIPVTGNTNHPALTVVCGGGGNLRKGYVTMLYGALELAAEILGICKEYKAQAIVQEIANSLTMPI